MRKFINIQDIPEIKEKYKEIELSSSEAQTSLVEDIYKYADERCWAVLQIVCIPLSRNGVGITVVYYDSIN